MPSSNVQMKVNQRVQRPMDDARNDKPAPPGPILRVAVDHGRWAGIVSLAAVYFIAARLGLQLDAVGGFASPVWPPTGIAIAALALFGTGLWPGIALGALAANIAAGAPLLAAAGMAAGNTLEALFAVALMRGPQALRASFDRISDPLRFVLLAAASAPVVSATLGVASGYFGGVIPSISIERAWASWWLGDFMGALVVTPLLLAWADRPSFRPTLLRITEGVALCAAFAFFGRLVFWGGTEPLIQEMLRPSALFPLLIWAALRFGRIGAVTSVAALSLLAIVPTAMRSEERRVGNEG